MPVAVGAPGQGGISRLIPTRSKRERAEGKEGTDAQALAPESPQRYDAGRFKTVVLITCY